MATIIKYNDSPYIWKDWEIEFLRENYPIRGKKWCIEKLGIKEWQVRYKASVLGLRIDKTSPLLDYDKESRYKKLRGKKRPEHSKKMKEMFKNGEINNKKEREERIIECIVCGCCFTIIAVKNSKSKVYDKKCCSKECRNKLSSVNAKKMIQENGHPKGMKGKKHSDELRKNISERSKAMWKDEGSKFNTKEFRQGISDRSVALHKSGIFTSENTYSNCKKGHFISGEKDYFLRSGWEFRYAAYLEMLKKGKAILDWEYEVDTFWFEKIKRGVRSYKPDFKIFNTDGSIEYHEVKGRMDPKSKTKLSRMKKYYPKIRLILRDEEYFKANKNVLPSYDFSVKKYGK